MTGISTPRLSLLLVALLLSTAPSAHAAGTLLWGLQLTGGVISPHSPGVGPDGTIYAANSVGLYAVAPDGAVQWILPERAYGGPVVTGADGTVYASTFDGFKAFTPEGVEKWFFEADPYGLTIAGPGVGPDGNIYGTFEVRPFDAIGVFALDPLGNLLWSNEGDPIVDVGSSEGQEIAFGADRLYVAFPGDSGVPPGLYGFDLDGDQFLYNGDGRDSVPAVGPSGDVYVAQGVWGVTAYAPDGSQRWTASPPASGFLLLPVVGPDGTVYTSINFDGFWALNPDGSTKWFIDDSDHAFMGPLGVAPDNSAVLDLGNDIGVSGWMRGYDPATGALLWQVDLPPGIGSIVVTSPPSFSPDGTVAYFHAVDLGDSGNTGYLFAVDLAGAGIACEDVVRMRARCRPGRVQAAIDMVDSSFDGMTMTVELDGVPRVVTVSGSRARMQVPFTGASATVELVEPSSCLPAQTVSCQ